MDGDLGIDLNPEDGVYMTSSQCMRAISNNAASNMARYSPATGNCIGYKTSWAEKVPQSAQADTNTIWKLPVGCTDIAGQDFNSTNLKALFKRYPEENIIMSNGLAGAYEGSTLQNCFDECSKDDDCHSVSYSETESLCNNYYENSTLGIL